MSKAAEEKLVPATLGLEIGPAGIQRQCPWPRALGPRPILPQALLDDERMVRVFWRSTTPAAPIGARPDDIARVIAFLVGPDSRLAIGSGHYRRWRIVGDRRILTRTIKAGRTMCVKRVVSLVGLLGMFWCLSAGAQIYTYVDENGNYRNLPTASRTATDTRCTTGLLWHIVGRGGGLGQYAVEVWRVFGRNPRFQ